MAVAARTRERYRVAVVRALPGIGDFLCAVPALRALRAALPFARIDLIGLAHNRPLVQRFERYIDELVEFPGYPGIPEVPLDPRRLFAFLSHVRHDPYDLVIQMHGDGSYMNDFAMTLGCPLVYGYHPADAPPPHRERFWPYPADEPEVRRNLRLVERLGAPTRGEQLEFPLTPLDAAELALVPEASRLVPGRYAVIHPGASCGEKRWAPEYFAAVADRLADEEMVPVLTGVMSEASLCRSVADEMSALAIDLTGRTSLGALAMLISGAALVVANDTGVSHLADALAVPSVVVFSASEVERWAPLDGSRHRVVDLSAFDGSYAATLAALLPSTCLPGVLEADEDDVRLSGVMAEVEYLLAMGGGSAS